MLSAAVLLPAVLFCVWSGGWWFAALMAAAASGLGMEWATLCGFQVRVWPGWVLPVAMGMAALFSGFGETRDAFLFAIAGAAITAVWASPGGALHMRQDNAASRGNPLPPRHGPVEPDHDARTMALPREFPPGAPYPDAYGASPATINAAAPNHRAALILGFPYIGLAAIAMPWLRADPAVGWPNMLFVLAVVWGSDIGAYMAGRLVGGPKLAPAISPGKTWSGAIGGLIAAALAGLATAACFSSQFSSSHVVAVAIGLGVVAQAGDLLESAAKRHFGVKDSGHVIPGHGGLLDRLDALLTVAPVAAMLAFSVGRGVVLWQ